MRRFDRVRRLLHTRASLAAVASVLSLLLLLALPSSAGIYKCVGPDGKTVFTGNPGACSNAKPHRLTKKVQRAIETPRASSRTRSTQSVRGRAGADPAARSNAASDGLEQMWRRKRADKEMELREVEREWNHLQGMIKGCNRGGQWFRKDASGIRQHVPCNEVKQKRVEIEKRRDQLTAYLAGGIEDECRKAGCLPGWIR